MDYQYIRENGARNIYSNCNQMRAYVECSPNQSKKLIPYRPFYQAIEETLTIPEHSVLAVSLSQFYQSIAVQL